MELPSIEVGGTTILPIWFTMNSSSSSNGSSPRHSHRSSSASSIFERNFDNPGTLMRSAMNRKEYSASSIDACGLVTALVHSSIIVLSPLKLGMVFNHRIKPVSYGPILDGGVDDAILWSDSSMVAVAFFGLPWTRW